MRIWSLHPAQLDRAGLIAGWREALLAQAVLAGRTKGYRQHPQLIRFQAAAVPLDAIGVYLHGLQHEATRRGYRFDAGRILSTGRHEVRLTVTQGQLDHEWLHLGAKLAVRSPAEEERWRESSPAPHPMFDVIAGEKESWERS